MPDAKERKKREEREGHRGLFTLGLMAVLISLRVNQTKIEFGNIEFTGVIDLTLVLWGTYALLMIASLSPDLLSERFCDICYMLGIGFLLFSFALFYVIAIALTTSLPAYWNIAALLVLLIPIYYVIIQLIRDGCKRLKARLTRTSP